MKDLVGSHVLLNSIGSVKLIPKEEEIMTPSCSPKKYSCDECNFSSSHLTALKRHKQNIHSTQSDIALFSCTLCEYSTKYKSSLKRHFDVQHDKNNVKLNKCTLCDYTSSYSSTVERHIQTIHHKAKEFYCSQCEYSTVHKFSLVRHVRALHQEDKSYSCNLCTFSSARKSDLKLHISTVHQAKKAHRCGGCGFETLYRTALLRHISQNNCPIILQSSGTQSADNQLTPAHDHADNQLNSAHEHLVSAHNQLVSAHNHQLVSAHQQIVSTVDLGHMESHNNNQEEEVQIETKPFDVMNTSLPLQLHNQNSSLPLPLQTFAAQLLGSSQPSISTGSPHQTIQCSIDAQSGMVIPIIASKSQPHTTACTTVLQDYKPILNDHIVDTTSRMKVEEHPCNEVVLHDYKPSLMDVFAQHQTVSVGVQATATIESVVETTTVDTHEVSKMLTSSTHHPHPSQVGIQQAFANFSPATVDTGFN